MATAILAMLFIGVGMVSTVSLRYWTLVNLHKPLGLCILLLAVLRLGVRLRHGAPPLPLDLSWPQRAAAKASHVALYGLMLAMPLIGWGMLSAGGYPVELYGTVWLPSIAPVNDRLHTLLQMAHVWLAFALFVTVLLHLAAALFHGLIRRDGVFSTMVPGHLSDTGLPTPTRDLAR